MGGGKVEAQCLIKIGKRKKSVVLKIKLCERGEYCVYFYLYKSKYSTINIQFSYLNFKNFHLHLRQETNKKVGQYNSLLTHFICRVNDLEYAWVWDHGYRYRYIDMGIRDQVKSSQVKLYCSISGNYAHNESSQIYNQE